MCVAVFWQSEAGLTELWSTIRYNKRKLTYKTASSHRSSDNVILKKYKEQIKISFYSIDPVFIWQNTSENRQWKEIEISLLRCLRMLCWWERTLSSLFVYNWVAKIREGPKVKQVWWWKIALNHAWHCSCDGKVPEWVVGGDLSYAHNHWKQDQNLALDEKSKWNRHLFLITSVKTARRS